jgi:hypothetical protein
MIYLPAMKWPAWYSTVGELHSWVKGTRETRYPYPANGSTHTHTHTMSVGFVTCRKVLIQGVKAPKKALVPGAKSKRRFWCNLRPHRLLMLEKPLGAVRPLSRPLSRCQPTGEFIKAPLCGHRADVLLVRIEAQHVFHDGKSFDTVIYYGPWSLGRR